MRLENKIKKEIKEKQGLLKELKDKLEKLQGEIRRLEGFEKTLAFPLELEGTAIGTFYNRSVISKKQLKHLPESLEAPYGYIGLYFSESSNDVLVSKNYNLTVNLSRTLMPYHREDRRLKVKIWIDKVEVDES